MDDNAGAGVDMQMLQRITEGSLFQAELPLIASQQEVARLEGENRELRDKVQALEAIIKTLTDLPY